MSSCLSLIMHIVIFTSYFTTIAFILPVFRQYKSNFFLYFFFIAISGPVSHAIYYADLQTLIGMNQNIVIILFSHLLLYSLHYNMLNKIVNIFFAGFYGGISIVIYLILDYPELFFYIMIVHIIVTFFLISKMFKDSFKYLRINFFYVFLLLFETSVILKYLSLINDLNTGIYYFSITNLFQALLAIYFMIFRNDKPVLAYHFIKDEEFMKDREDTLIGYNKDYW